MHLLMLKYGTIDAQERHLEVSSAERVARQLVADPSVYMTTDQPQQPPSSPGSKRALHLGE